MPLSSTTAPWVHEGIDLQAIWMVLVDEATTFCFGVDALPQCGAVSY
ncbi:MAG: hypothetical protein RLZZ206_823 [Cyanobacteriota bacterium]|jgi:hypothetical protein